MSEDSNISGAVGLDTTDFKTKALELGRQIKVIQTGFEASTASMGNWSKTSEGLELRIKALTDKMELQKKIVANLTSEYEKVVEKKGNDSRAAQELLIKLNNQNTALGKMQSELREDQDALEKMGKESAKAGEKIQDIGTKTDKSAERAEKFQKVLQATGTVLKETAKVAVGLVTAVAGIGAAVGTMVLKTAAASDSLVELSDKTGISVEKLQEMNYVSKQVGVETETITGSMSKLIRNMDSARSGTGAAADAFKALGVSVIDSNGQLRSNQDVFAEVIDKLGQMPNETERDAAAMAILGKSAMELNPLIKTGSDNIAKLTEEAHKSGAVIKTETVQGMADLNDTIDGLKDGLMGTVGTLSGSFLPAFQGLAGKAQGYLGQLAGIVKGSNGDIGAAAGGIAGLITTVVTDAVAAAPNLLQGGLGIIQGLISGIMGNITVLIPAVINMLMTLVKFILTNIPILLDAAIQIVIALANGITSALPTLIPSIIQAVITIVMTLLENLPMLIDAALKIILALAEGLIAALPVLIEALPGIMTALVQQLFVLCPMIGVAAVQLITTLAFGIVQNIPLLIKALAQGISDIVAYFKTTDWRTIGKDLVDGLSKGFMAQWEYFKQNVVSAFSAMVDFIKHLLGINSPSTLFAGIGLNMAAGLGIGFTRELANVQRQINGLMAGGFGLQPSFAGGMGTNSYDQSQRFANYGTVIIQDNTGQSLVEAAKAKRW